KLTVDLEIQCADRTGGGWSAPIPTLSWVHQGNEGNKLDHQATALRIAESLASYSAFIDWASASFAAMDCSRLSTDCSRAERATSRFVKSSVVALEYCSNSLRVWARSVAFFANSSACEESLSESSLFACALASVTIMISLT